MRTLNRQIACKPLENTAVKSKTVGSLRVGDFGHGGVLLPLTTVIDFEGVINDLFLSIDAGSTVYVKADCIQHPWTKAICTCGGVVGEDGKTPVPFILVPGEQVVVLSSAREVTPKYPA